MILAIPFSTGVLAANATRVGVTVLAAAGRYVELIAMKLGGDGNTPNDKNIVVEVCRGDDLGTGATATPVWTDGQTVTPLTTAKQNVTVAPANLVPVEAQVCSASGGVNDPSLDLLPIRSELAKALALRFTVPNGNQSVTVTGTLYVRGA